MLSFMKNHYATTRTLGVIDDVWRTAELYTRVDKEGHDISIALARHRKNVHVIIGLSHDR